MSLQKAIEKAKALFPIGSKVEFQGTFISGFQKGTGEVYGYNLNPNETGFVKVKIKSDLGDKEFIVADPDDKNFQFDKSKIRLIN